jgi:hypothetical protein
MSDNPEYEADLHKEFILSRAPFTKTFLDEGSALDKLLWKAKLAPHEEKIQRELKDLFGEDNLITILHHVIIMAENMRIFERTMSKEEGHRIISSIVEIGYEIGNLQDCMMIIGDLFSQLDDIGALKDGCLTTNASEEKTVDTISGLLEVGTDFRIFANEKAKHSTLDTPQSPDNDPRLDVFKNFLDKQGNLPE